MTTNHAASLVYHDSLARTLEAVHGVLFFGGTLTIDQHNDVVHWLADRQGLPGAYAGMFSPTETDLSYGVHTFTGESLRSSASIGHILSEETLAALFYLQSDLPEVQNAIERARYGLFRRMDQGGGGKQAAGVYCCGMCSAALWRHLGSSKREEDYHRLENGMLELKRCRDGLGRWNRFPYYYTLLALSNLDLPEVREEMRYAAHGIERALRRAEKILANRDETELERRRRVVMGRVLEKC